MSVVPAASRFPRPSTGMMPDCATILAVALPKVISPEALSIFGKSLNGENRTWRNGSEPTSA